MCIVSKRARVSYGAPVCRVMHADPETTSEYGTLRVSYRSCRILERCSLAPKLRMEWPCFSNAKLPFCLLAASAHLRSLYAHRAR